MADYPAAPVQPCRHADRDAGGVTGGWPRCRRGVIAEQLAGDPAAVLAELAAAGLVYRAHDDPERWEPAIDHLYGCRPGPRRDARRLTNGDDRYDVNVAALSPPRVGGAPGAPAGAPVRRGYNARRFHELAR